MTGPPGPASSNSRQQTGPLVCLSGPSKPERRMSDQDQMSGQMSKPEQGSRRFNNEDTVLRRAWIERALAGVRDHLEVVDLPVSRAGGPSPGPSPGLSPGPGRPEARPATAERPSGPPRLVIVPGGRGR